MSFIQRWVLLQLVFLHYRKYPFFLFDLSVKHFVSFLFVKIHFTELLTKRQFFIHFPGYRDVTDVVLGKCKNE